MAENKHIPSFTSLQNLVDFFDTHDMGEQMQGMPEAHFEVAIKRRTYLIAIDENVMNQVFEIAKGQKVSPEQLINTWIKERLLNAA